MEETKAEPAQKTTPLAAQPDHHHKWNPFVAKRVAMKLASPAHAAPAAPAAAPARRWWLAATASDDGAVQISKDPEKTRRALEASRLTSLDDRLQAAVSSEGAVPGSTVLPAPLSKRLAWTMMDKKYAHDMLFDVAHMARHVAGFEKLVVVALDQKTTRACAAGGISAASAGASQTGGVQTSGRMKGVSNALVEVVQGAKFKASLWFLQKGYDFVFFEADVCRHHDILSTTGFLRPAADKQYNPRGQSCFILTRAAPAPPLARAKSPARSSKTSEAIR